MGVENDMTIGPLFRCGILRVGMRIEGRRAHYYFKSPCTLEVEMEINYPEGSWKMVYTCDTLFKYAAVCTYLSSILEKDMGVKRKPYQLPKPTAIHHIVEDFLTDFSAPLSHILPLR